MAVNLGDDSDTIGAVFGQLAGAYYGLSGIPAVWVDTIADGQYIISMAARLYERRYRIDK